MSKAKLNTYRPSIDPKHSEDGQELGIDLISNVVEPAVKIRGVAFSSHKIKDLKFRDDIKMRIAAPVLVPSNIYRDDEDEEYYMQFTIEDIEIIAKDFMSKLNRKVDGVFNLDHKDQMVESYIFEAILVDSESKIEMIKNDYNIDLPLGSFFIVQQFNDREIYDDIVRRGATSFSLQGFMGTELIKEFKFKQEVKIKKEVKMKKQRKLIGTKRVFMSASKRLKLQDEAVETDDLILIADEFKEGEEIKVMEDTDVEEKFSGEVDVEIDGKETVLIIEEGKITEIVEDETETEVELEEDKDEKKEVELEEDKDEKKEVELEDETGSEEATEAVVDVKKELEELYKILADIKVAIDELKIEDKEEEEVIVKEQNYTNALRSFNRFQKTK